MRELAVSDDDVREVRQTLKNLKKPTKLGQSKWVSSCLIDRYLSEGAKYQTPKALLRVFSDVLDLLRDEEPEYADILYSRFWKGVLVKTLLYSKHRDQWTERTFYNVQKKAIERFTHLLLEQEELCKQQIEDSTGESKDAADTLTQSRLNASWLPSRSYRELVGRNAVIDQIMDVLRDTEGRWVIGVDGLGGIGKTALAIEVANRCLEEKLFDIAVWSRATDTNPLDNSEARGGLMTFQTILDAIGFQLGSTNISKLVGEKKEAQVHTLLRDQRVLVVLDNMETAAEPQYEIVRRLQPLFSPSKALLTSRHRFSGNIYTINLTGLVKQGAKDFIRQVAFEKNIGNVKTLKDQGLDQIIHSTGGSPLAMSLVVGQLNHLPLEVVLDQLQNIRLPDDTGDEDDYFRFYKFIFSTSAQLLTDDGERLLYWMTHFPAGVGGTLKAIKSSPTLNLTDEVLHRGIDELWRLSFLEVTKESSWEQRRYYLHALTKHFVLADMLKLLR